MTTIFQTETGSTYELDIEGKRLRRIEGMTAPTDRVGDDGAWRPFAEVSDVVKGLRVMVIWGWDAASTEAGAELVARTTITSRVISLRERTIQP